MVNAGWIQRVEATRLLLTKQEQNIIDYLQTNFSGLSHFSIEDLADVTNSSRPTIYRLCRKMGYKGFKELKEAMSDLNQSIVASTDEFNSMLLTPGIASDDALQETESAFEIFQRGFAVDIQALQRTAVMCSEEQIKRLVNMILQAEIVYSVGYETSCFPAKFLAERLSRLRKRVQIAVGEQRYIIDMIFPMSNKDIVMLFEYHKNFPLDMEILQFARAHDTKTILLTNYPTSPAIPLADETLVIPRGSVKFKHSMSIPMTFVNNLLLAVEFTLGDQRAEALQQWEAFHPSPK